MTTQTNQQILDSMITDSEIVRRLLSHSEVPIAACPGWTMTDLVEHVGGAHRWALAVVHAGGAPVERHLPTAAGAVGPWFSDGLTALVEAFDSCGQDDIVWNPFDADGRVDWWIAKMAVETALHRWDAENAVGEPQAIDEQVAALGVDEMTDSFIPGLIALNHGQPTGDLHLRTPTRDWDVRLGDGPGDCEVAGTASNVLLFLWNRLPDVHARLDIIGGDALVPAWSDIKI